MPLPRALSQQKEKGEVETDPLLLAAVGATPRSEAPHADSTSRGVAGTATVVSLATTTHVVAHLVGDVLPRVPRAGHAGLPGHLAEPEEQVPGLLEARGGAPLGEGRNPREVD